MKPCRNIYYDSFTASTGENGYDGTLAMCESRSASNPQSPGFAFSDTNDCTIYMNNGQVRKSIKFWDTLRFGLPVLAPVLPLGCLSLRRDLEEAQAL